MTKALVQHCHADGQSADHADGAWAVSALHEERIAGAICARVGGSSIMIWSGDGKKTVNLEKSTAHFPKVIRAE
jgi:hypothetical protein